MNRRQFLKLTSTTAAALAAASYVPTTFAAEKPRRVGLIGAGWYGKKPKIAAFQLCGARHCGRVRQSAADFVLRMPRSHERGHRSELMTARSLTIGHEVPP